MSRSSSNAFSRVFFSSSLSPVERISYDDRASIWPRHANAHSSNMVIEFVIECSCARCHVAGNHWSFGEINIHYNWNLRLSMLCPCIFYYLSFSQSDTLLTSGMYKLCILTWYPNSLLLLSDSCKFLKISLLYWSFQSIWKVLLSCFDIIEYIGVTLMCDSKQVNYLKRAETQIARGCEFHAKWSYADVRQKQVDYIKKS